MADSSNPGATAKETLDRAAEKHRRDVFAHHLRTLKWEATSYAVHGPLRVLSDASGRTAIYAADGKHLTYLGESFDPADVEQVERLAKMRRILSKWQAEILVLQASIAARLLDAGLTLRQTAAAVELTQGRITQIVGSGRSKRAHKASSVQP